MWSKLSDNYVEEVLRLSAQARVLDIDGLVYCSHAGNDGFLATDLLRRAASPAVTDPEAAMAELVDFGLWTEVDGGWQRDWSDQLTKDEADERKAAHAERQRKYADRLKRHNRGDHSLCKFCKPDASGDASSDASADTPRPTRPSRKGRGGKGTGSRPSRLEGAPALTRDDWMAEAGTPEAAEQEHRMNEAMRADGVNDGDMKRWNASGGVDRFIEAERARLSNPTERL